MKNRLVKDSFLILLTNAMTYLSTMANTRIVSATFSLTDYGYRAQVISIVAILVSIFSLGLSNCPNYFIPLSDANEKNAAEKIVRNLYLSAAVVSLFMAFITFVFFGLIVDYYKSPMLENYKIIIVIMVAEQIFYSFYSGIQISQHRAIRATITNFIRSIVTVVVTAVICLTIKTIFAVIVSTLIVDISFCIFTLIDSSHPRLRIGRWFDLSLISAMAKYCIPLGVSTITAGLCAQIDKLFVVRFYTPEDLAVYSNMCTELPLAAISGAFIAVISPYIVKFVNSNNTEKAIYLWGRVIEFVSYILFLIIAGLFTFSKQAVYILYSDKYVEGYILFQIFILVEISRITYFGLILRSYGKSLLILLCSALTMVLDIILNSISYYVFDAGLIGFAVATMISTFTIQVLQLLLSSRISNVPFGKIFPWVALLKSAMINIAFSVVFFLIARLLGIEDSLHIITYIPLGVAWIMLYLMVVRKKMVSLYKEIRSIEV